MHIGSDSPPIQMGTPPAKPTYSVLDNMAYSLVSRVGSIVGNKKFKAKLVNNLLPTHALTISAYTTQLKAYVDQLDVKDVHNLMTAAKIMQDRSRQGREETQAVEKEQYQYLLNKLPPDYRSIIEKREFLKNVLETKDIQNIEDASRVVFQSWSQETDPDKSREKQDLFILMLPHLPLRKYSEFLNPFFAKTLEKNNPHESEKAYIIANDLEQMRPFPNYIANVYFHDAMESHWERLRDQVNENKKKIE